MSHPKLPTGEFYYIRVTTSGNRKTHTCGNTSQKLTLEKSQKMLNLAFSRQIFEAALIFRAGDKVLNSKAEFNRAKVPGLSVMINEGHQESFKKTNLNQEELEVEIKLLRRRKERQG